MLPHADKQGMRNVVQFIILFASLWAIRAEATPTTLTFQSKIYKPDGHTLEAASVAFRFTTMDALGTCVLYVEDFNAVNMQSSTGQVVFNLGGGTKVYPAGAYTYTNVYNNMQPSFNCQSGGTFTPGLTDKRKVVMQFNDGVGGWQTAQAVDINSVPFANYASDSQKLAGYTASDFVLSSTIPNCDATGKILTYNGTSFVCVAVAGTGTVTNVTSANSYISVATGTTTPVITANVGTAANTLAAGNDSRITGAAQKANNLSDLASAATARTNLGLGGAAVLAVGTGAGTVAAGDDARIVGAVQSTAYTADVANVLDSNCGTNATPKWNVALDAWTCVGISLNASAITAGTVATARLGSGTADATTYLRGDGTWATPSASTPANTQLVYQVRAATNADIALTGLQIIDDVVLVAGDRVLVKAQTTVQENGVYVAAAGAWSRAADLSTWAQAIGYITVVTEGTSFGALRFSSNAVPGGTLGTTQINWIPAGSSNPNSGITALGVSALNLNTTGLHNTGIGRSALSSNSSGNFNTAVGNTALALTSSGSQNTAVGSYAAQINTTGSDNTSIGHNSLLRLTTGSSNVAVGQAAGYWGSDLTSALTTGNQNTFVGAGSGASTANGAGANRVTLLGNGSSAAFPTSQTGVNTYATAIGASSTVTTVNTVVLGRTTDTTVIGATGKLASTALLQVVGGGYFGGSVGVSGVTSPTAKLHIAAGTAAAGTGPLKLTAGTNLTTPEAGAIEFDGTNLYFTDSTPTRRTIAVAGGGGGTVTNVTSANSYLSVATGTTTPVLTANVGTGANTLAAGDDSRITGAVQQTAYNGDIANVLDSNCGVGSTPKWNVAGDMWTCVAIGSLPASAITSGTIATARLGSGTADATTYLRGDGTWATPSASLPADTSITYKVRAATNANIALTGTQTIDDVVLAVGDRVLVKTQSTQSQNGVYVVAAGAWARAADLSSSAQAIGYNVFVTEGTTFGSITFQSAAVAGDTLGTSPLIWKMMGVATNGITGFGYGVLGKSTGAGTAFGYWALRDNTTGTSNSAFGSQALSANTTGDSNTAIGSLASGVSTTGTNNTAMGFRSLGGLTTGNSNVGVGKMAGFLAGDGLNALSTGSNNVFIGSETGSTNTNGTGADKVTLIGDTATTSFTASQSGVSTYATAIGAGANVRTTNTVVLGRTTDTTVIGNHTRSASPALLQVTGSGYFSSSVAVGVATAPTGKVHVAAGTAAAGTAPIKLTAGTNLGTPEAGAIEFDGTNLYYTDSTPTRRTIATSAASGTVTNVTSANSYLSVATGTTTPVITANVGTGANTLAAGDDSRITGAVQQTAYNGDIANVLDSNCGVGSTPKWNVAGDMWTCVAIGSLPASAITSGTIATARLGSGTADATTYLRGDGTWAAGSLPSDTTITYKARVASSANITLSGTQTIDDIAVVAGDRVLVMGNGYDNGVYVVAAGAWARAADFSTTAQAIGGYTVLVTEGTYFGGILFGADAFAGYVMGSAALFWKMIGSSSNGMAGFGTSVLTSNTVGANNSGFGFWALRTNTSGGLNSAFGAMSLSGNTTGDNNTAVGSAASGVSTTGSGNTAVGANSLYRLSTGSNNVAVGRDAGTGSSVLYALFTGSNNVYVGADTGSTNSAGTGADKVTLIGDAARTTFTSSQAGVSTYATAIGAGANVRTTNTVVLGRTTDTTVIGNHTRSASPALLQVTGSGYFSSAVSVGVATAATGKVHIAAGTAAAGTAPIKLTSGTNLTTPEAGAIEFDGTNLYFTDSTPTRRTIATTASAGTVTNVTSANSYLSIATGTTTPVITANVGTGANTLAAGDDSRITGAVQQTAYNGDIANVLDSNCGVGSTPKWNTVADGWTCVAIGSLNASAITAGTIATARLGSGTADATTYLRGDGTWATPSGGLPANTQVVYQVRAVSVGNVALTGTQTIDGVALGVGDRVLLRSQTAPAENGVYVVAAGAWSRAADMSTWAQTVGYEVVVLEGTSWSGFKFFSTTAPGGTLETTAIRMNTYGKPNLMNGSLQSSTSFGRLANSSTTANYVTSIGYQANASGTAAANTSVGYQALYMGTSGGSNVAIGASALVWTTTGTDNIGIGRYAGGPSSFDGNVTGSHNIYIGSNTGPSYNDNATGANYVTLLGDGASTLFSSSQTGVDTYATAIGAGALVSTTNTIVLGQPTDATVIGALGKNGGGALLQVTGSAGISAGLGLGVNAPGASSILEMSSTTKGVVLPRMTKAQRDAIAAPVAGMMVYQTDNTPGLRVHNGTNWMRFTETAD